MPGVAARVREFEVIGVPWRIETPEPLPDAALARVLRVAERFDAAWSRFRPDSLVRGIVGGGEARFPEESGELAEVFRMLARVTGGRVSPLIGGALEALGYGPGYRLTPTGEALPAPTWPETLDWHGCELRLRAPAVLDIGAAGKGMLVDLVSAELRDAGQPEHVVDASGDVARRGGGAPDRVALEHPDDPELAIGIVELGDGALAASATNRRAWAGVHHVIDALDGRPVREVRATWALADRCVLADGAATALFFVPGSAIPGLRAWARMFADGRVERSTDFPGEVFAA